MNFIIGTSPLIFFSTKHTIWLRIQTIAILIYFPISCYVLYKQYYMALFNLVTGHIFLFILFFLSLISMSLGTILCWIIRWQFSSLFYKIVKAILKVRHLLSKKQDDSFISIYLKMFLFIIIVNLIIAFCIVMTIPIINVFWMIWFFISIWFWDWVVISFVLNFIFIEHYFILLNKVLESTFYDVNFCKYYTKSESDVIKMENNMKAFCKLHESIQNLKALIEYPVFKNTCLIFF